MKLKAPYFPIIYVRGYAMTGSEIEATTSTPYMGFNLGATRLRQHWDGRVQQHFFESPLIRLMKEHGYQDAYADGIRLEQGSEPIPPRTVFIHRYYDSADADFGDGETLSIEEAAAALQQTIARIRERVCGDDPQARKAFRVHLVAHSMGGLICRCLLQNDRFWQSEEAGQVDRLFTYATPHNGIEMLGMNVPRFLGLWDMNNFNRRRIAEYLSLPDATDVSGLNGRFDPQRVFCLVGTNPGDYDVAGGWSSRLAGARSDGLVRVENANVRGAPRAFVYRSHSGAFGIVNSEEGYQNLSRFLFGDLRVDGTLEIESLPLPPALRKEKQAGRKVRASYFFEATISPRAGGMYTLSERRKATHSAIFRKYDELLKTDKPRWPCLFSTFLDSARITVGRTLVFSADVVVSATDYEVDGVLMFRRHIPGENLFRDTVVIRATRQEDGWRLRYNLGDESWGEGLGRDAEGTYIPLRSRKGFVGRLRLDIQPWQ